MDLQYHDIRPDRGLYYKLVARDMVEDRITDDETIERAKHEPPQTTRARLRGEFIRQANLKGKDYPRRLGLPEAERPRARDDPLQGPVPVPRRTGRTPLRLSERPGSLPGFRRARVRPAFHQRRELP